MIPLPPRPDRPLAPRLPGPQRQEVARALFDEHLDLAALRRALGQSTPREPQPYDARPAPEQGLPAEPDLAPEPPRDADPTIAPPQEARPPRSWRLLCAATAAGAATGFGLFISLSWFAIWPFDAPAVSPIASATPELAAPDLATPELATPELATPDLATPELAIPELAMPGLAAPETAAPQLATPELARPELARPELAAPQLAMPQLATPQLAIPDLPTPGLATAAPGGAPIAAEAPRPADDPPQVAVQPLALPPAPSPIGAADGLAAAAAPAADRFASLRLAALDPADAAPPPLPAVHVAPWPHPLARPPMPASGEPPILPATLQSARAVVHFHGSGPPIDRRAIETALRAAGFARVEWRRVNFGIGQSNVRFFHSQDRALAQKAGAALANGRRAAAPRDFTHYRPPTALGTVEIWVAG